MGLIQLIIAGVMKSAGKLLNTIFGWATTLLFGRVTKEKEISMSIATFGSVLWLFALITLISPHLGMVILAAFIPQDIERFEGWIRLGAAVAVVIIPIVVGLTSATVKDGRDPKQFALRTLADGYPYTVGLAVTMVLMMVLAPIMKLRLVVKRWSSEHVPAMVAPRDYVKAISDIERVLSEHGYKVTRRPASRMLVFPTKVLTMFAHNRVQQYVADELTEVCGEGFEILLHPSDLIISASEQTRRKLHGLLADKLPFSHLLLCWSDEAQRIEKEMRSLWANAYFPADPNAVWNRLKSVEERVNKLDIEHAEWEVLARERLKIVERLFTEGLKQERGRAA